MNTLKFTPASNDAFRSSSFWLSSSPSQKALKTSIEAFPMPTTPTIEKGTLNHGKQSSKTPNRKVVVTPLEIEVATEEVRI